MTILAGLWIDHARAFLIKSNAMGEMTIENFISGVEAKHHGGLGEGEHQTMVNQNSHDERRHNQMKAFSKTILEHLNNASELVVFGPGTAKHEFKNVLEDHKALAGKLAGVETTDELSEAEMKDYVKQYFHLPRN